MSLYIIQSNLSDIDNLVSVCTEQDAIVLIGDGIYLFQKIQKFKSSAKVHALESDAVRRGVKMLNEEIHCIDYPQFIDLTVLHSPIVNWG